MMRVLLVYSCVINLTFGFCGDHTLYAKLAQSTVQLSNSLREEYGDDVTKLEPHVTAAMIVGLRLVGHMPYTLKSDFKANDSYTVSDYLRTHLDAWQSQYKPLSKIRPGRLANMLQAISALCMDPQNFYGHNLTEALLESFASLKVPPYKNYFEYSSTALAVCQATRIQSSKARSIVLVLLRKTLSIIQSHLKTPDSVAMSIMALSCFKRSISEAKFTREVDRTIRRYTFIIVTALENRRDGKWNVQSKGLVVQAFMSLPKALRPTHWHCHRLLSAILSRHDAKKGFENVLASIQILPALLGKSLVHLNMTCHENDSPVQTKKMIKVCIRLAFEDSQHFLPDPLTLLVPEKTSAYEILALAAKRNHAFKFEALETSYGRMITTILNIRQNPLTGYYWSLYASEGSLALDGVDIFTPEDNSCVIFKYEKYYSSLEDEFQM